MTASVVLFEGRGSVFEPNRTLTLEAARRRSKAVRAMRALLTVAILGLGGAVGYFVAASGLNPPVVLDADQVDGDIRMVNPQFAGRDSSGSPFFITMQSAERADTRAELWQLASPKLDFLGRGNPASIVEAVRGLLDNRQRTLDLQNGVSFRTENGYSFKTDRALVYLDEGRVTGDDMIVGEGPMGSIRSQSFEIRDNVVEFSGDVVARLYPDRPTSKVSDAGTTLVQTERAPDTVDEPARPGPLTPRLRPDRRRTTGSR